jgi:hypothetical protein
MNILFVVPEKYDATSFYRAGGIVRDLQRKSSHRIDVKQWSETVFHWQLLSEYDIIMLQRPFTKVSADLCHYVKDMNKPLWVDYDDNLFALNPENRSFQTYNDPDTQANVRECLKMADVVTVPTEFLRQAYKQFNTNIQVIPNALNEDLLRRTELPKRERRMVWRGPEAHIYDMMTYGKEINLATIEFPDWNFLFMGFYPWFLAETNNKDFLPALDIIMYFKKLAEKCPAGMFIPLHDNTFNRCRSNIAYIEGTWAGACCITPGWWNVPGALPYNNAEEFLSAMRAVMSGEVDTVAQNNIAWEYVKDCLSLSKVNVMRLNVINELS